MFQEFSLVVIPERNNASFFSLPLAGLRFASSSIFFRSMSDPMAYGDGDGDGDEHAGATRTQLSEPLLPQTSPDETNEEARESSSICNDDGKNIVFPRWITCRGRSSPRSRLNHNVWLCLLLSTVYGLADSLWSGTVIAAFLKRLGRGKNGPVGDVEAVSGLASLISALPVGYLADKFRRDEVISAGGVLILVTAALHCLLLGWIGVDEEALDGDDRKRELSFFLLASVMALWGVGGGVINGPSQALYADSIPAGSRSRYYMYLFTSYMIASCAGPLVSIGLFQAIGDEWDLRHLRLILYVGLSMEAVAASVMFFFDDDKALPEGEGGGEQNENADTNDTSSNTDEEVAESEEIAERQEGQAMEQDGGNGPFNYGQRFIPIVLCLQSCVFAIGSGMTVKFFPLFFKEEVGMSPSQVQVIYVAVPIVMALLSGVGEKIAKGFGRVQTMILLNTGGVLCLFSMVFAKEYLDSHPFVLVPIYVLRTGLMNCTYPLNESILMDYVPKNERARWKSLDSVVSFGWCGSAALGGWLTDKYDYTYTFFITAIIQGIGIICFLPLVPLVPRKEQDLAVTPEEETEEESDD